MRNSRKHKNAMKVQALFHDRPAAEGRVMGKRGYRLEEREPTSSTGVGKCRVCEYNSVCPKSLFGALGRNVLSPWSDH
ncbi:MAG TPA: hypothetical protein VKF15_00645 [Nitrososphaerales archaeon]|nr:hypothetical protein [Nitrososphaerales archaeon]